MAEINPEKSEGKAAEAKAGADGKAKAEPKTKNGNMPSRRNTYIAAIVFISLFILVWRHYIEPKYLAEYRAPETTGGTQIQTAGLPKTLRQNG